MGAAPGITVTEPSPGTYRFKGSTTTGAGSWDNLTSVVHVDAGTYTMDATDWPLGNNSWLMGIQAHISHDDGSEGANAFKPRDYGPKTLKAGTLQCNIFVNTTGEVDKTFTPRLYKKRLILAPHHTVWGFSIDGPEWAVTILTHDRGPQNNIHLRERGKIG